MELTEDSLKEEYSKCGYCVCKDEISIYSGCIIGKSYKYYVVTHRETDIDIYYVIGGDNNISPFLLRRFDEVFDTRQEKREDILNKILGE